MIEEKEDFFEQTPEEKPKKEKEPKPEKISPDDPRYYEREEGKWEHLTPSPYRRAPLLFAAVGIVVIVVLLIGLYIYIFTPKTDQAVQYGYVENVQRERGLFETYEGVLLPYKSLMDTVRPYEGDFAFSTPDEHLASELRRRRHDGVPVMVGYKVYRYRMPWRGQTKVIITSVDSVNPRTILPPDRQPEHL